MDFQLKKIDKMLVKGFIPPFIMTFFIAMFVLNMQFLWKYIDEMVGKGLEISLILELLFYYAVAMIPLSLLLAILIAGVMVIGNLAEHHELTSIKSAGVPLLRTMAPLVALSAVMGCFSFICSNYLIPEATQKFKARLYDIRKHKPALSLDVQQFNQDFKDFVIYIKDKSADDQTLLGIRFYDHTKRRGNLNQTNADKGYMTYTPDKRYMVMKLENGERFEELDANGKNARRYPFLRMKFKEYTSSFDLQQFDTKKSDDELFKNNYMSMDFKQLSHARDSLKRRLREQGRNLRANTDPSYFFAAQSTQNRPSIEKRDSIRQYVPEKNILQIPDSIKNAASFVEVFKGGRKEVYIDNAVKDVESLQRYIDNVCLESDGINSSTALFTFELNRKVSLATACILFLFIGAPLGAIIRKGGFGWPILSGIIFFTIYFVLNITGEKMSKGLSISPILGAWLPILLLFPIGLRLTWLSMRDSQAMNMDTYLGFFKRIWERVQR